MCTPDNTLLCVLKPCRANESRHLCIHRPQHLVDTYSRTTFSGLLPCAHHLVQLWHCRSVVHPRYLCRQAVKLFPTPMQGSGSVLATMNTGLVKERSSAHAWDLSGEGGIHAHSQFLHLKLRSAARLGATAAAEQQHAERAPAEDALAEPARCEDKSQQVNGSEGRPTQPEEHARLSTEELKSLGLRYFSPREIARLHSFPEAFSFPQHVTLRQQYALLGNSVSALVIADLLEYLLHAAT